MPLTHMISPHEALAVLDYLNMKPLPQPQVMFPWLYSAAPDCFPPNNIKNFVYFVRSSAIANDDIVENSALLRNTITPHAILSPRSTLDSISVREAFSNHLLQLGLIVEEEDILVDELLADSLALGLDPIFAEIPRNMCDIRSFNLQLPKLLLTSDFVVYCFNKDHMSPKAAHCKCLSVARMLAVAQQHQWRQMAALKRAQEESESLKSPEPRMFAGFDNYDDDNGESDGEKEIDFSMVLSQLKKHTFAPVRPVKSPLTSMLEASKMAESILNNGTYKTFIIDNCSLILKSLSCSFSSDLKLFRSLISVPPFSSKGNLVTDIDNVELIEKPSSKPLTQFEVSNLRNFEMNFNSKGKFEIWKISCASEVHQGVWAGNDGDYFMWKDLPSHCDLRPYKSNGIARYCDPRNSIIIGNPQCYLDNRPVFNSKVPFDEQLLNRPVVNWKMFISISRTSGLPPLMMLDAAKRLMDSGAGENIHLTFPASGSIGGLGNLSTQHILTIVNMCKLIYYKDHSRYPLLVYCSEGYTETSLFMMIYMMFATGKRLQDVVFEYHVNCDRPFYLFENDFTLLKELELVLLCYTPCNTDELLKYTSVWDKVKQMNKTSSLEKLNDFNTDLIGDILISNYSGNSVGFSSDWFNSLVSSAGSGSIIPSHILPDLYLGSLDHANNKELLKKINITTLVSVGECVSWLKKLPEDLYSVEDLYSTDSRPDLLQLVTFDEEKKQKDSQLADLSVNQILIIQGVSDNGVDTISTDLFFEICKFFEKYTASDLRSILDGTPNKIFVHCKVGVSRSATVVICYLMKFLGLTFEAAYLYVRVRRLNIIIQPNLRLVYELFKFQEELKKIVVDQTSESQDLFEPQCLSKVKDEESAGIKALSKIDSRQISLDGSFISYRNNDRKKSNVSEVSSSSSIPMNRRSRQWSISSSAQTALTSEEFSDEESERLEEYSKFGANNSPSTVILETEDEKNNVISTVGKLEKDFEPEPVQWLRSIDWGLFGFQVDSLNDF